MSNINNRNDGNNCTICHCCCLNCVFNSNKKYSVPNSLTDSIQHDQSALCGLKCCYFENVFYSCCPFICKCCYFGCYKGCEDNIGMFSDKKEYVYCHALCGNHTCSDLTCICDVCCPRKYDNTCCCKGCDCVCEAVCGCIIETMGDIGECVSRIFGYVD